MKLLTLIKRLEKRRDDIKEVGGNPQVSEVMLEAIDDNGQIYYEDNFDLFVDDNNDIGLSPISN